MDIILYVFGNKMKWGKVTASLMSLWADIGVIDTITWREHQKLLMLCRPGTQPASNS